MPTAKNVRLEMERSIIENCCKKLRSDELNAIARNCSKLIVNSSSEKIVSDDFEMPPYTDIGEMIRKDLDWNFDEEKVVADIRHTYTGWSEEQVNAEVDKLDDMFEEECSKQQESIIKTTVKACLAMAEDKQKEGKV